MVLTCSYIAEAVNTQIHSEDLGRLFAVVHVAGFQRKVTVNDIIVVETSSYPTVGTRIRLEKVGGGVYELDMIYLGGGVLLTH